MKHQITSGGKAKRCIVVALIDLLKQQPYETISVTDICTKAGVSRMTYYRNFSSKEEVLESYLREMGEELQESLGQSHTKRDDRVYFHLLFERLGSYSDIGLIAHRANLGRMVLRSVTGYMLLSFPTLASTELGRYRCVCLAGAFYNLLVTWIRESKQQSTDYMAQIMCSLLERLSA